MNKLKKLKDILTGMQSVLVAFSGGVDSTLLLKICHDLLGENVLAVTADSPTYPPEELVAAKKLCRALGVKHEVIRTAEVEDHRFNLNPANRCYFCKRELFNRLKTIAKKHSLRVVVDASNVADKLDYRPGNKAKKELGVRSPLQEAGFDKDEIRGLSKQMGLSTWDKPSLACLASRVPYGVKITPQILQKVNKAEEGLRRLGFRQVRVRHYNGLCRIEVPRKDFARIMRNRDKVIASAKNAGYAYITVDLQGYRTGSLNEGIKK